MTENHSQTRLWLLNTYGPTMTQDEVAAALSMSSETLRSKIWREHSLPWIRALHNAERRLGGRKRIYTTTAVADIVEGAYDTDGQLREGQR